MPTEREFGELESRVLALEAEMVRIRLRLHDHANQLFSLQHPVVPYPVGNGNGNGNGSNWPVTFRHVSIAMGTVLATIGFLKLLGMLR